MTRDEWTGRRVGTYTIIRKLGAGGMGVVYVGEQTSLGREVALKVLRRTPATSEALVTRFRREAKVVSALAHPNIVTLYDFGEEPELMYIAMELVPGHTLRSVMMRHGPFSEGETLPIVRDVASALAHAAQHRVVHRDLKPENVMLMPTTGRAPLAKVLDFGIARLMAEDSTGLTGTGMVVGTPAYIAPEVVGGMPDIDARADTYALGVIWFEMLTCRTPFMGTSPMSLAIQQIQQPAPRVSSFVGVSQGVDDLVALLLERQPSRRLDAQQLIEHIDKFTKTMPALSLRPLSSDSLAFATTVATPAVADSTLMRATAPTMTELPSQQLTLQAASAAAQARPRSPIYAALGAFAATLVIAAIAAGVAIQNHRDQAKPDAPTTVSTAPPATTTAPPATTTTAPPATTTAPPPTSDGAVEDEATDEPADGAAGTRTAATTSTKTKTKVKTKTHSTASTAAGKPEGKPGVIEQPGERKPDIMD